jgi:hypothetical protein
MLGKNRLCLYISHHIINVCKKCLQSLKNDTLTNENQQMTYRKTVIKLNLMANQMCFWRN